MDSIKIKWYNSNEFETLVYYNLSVVSLLSEVRSWAIQNDLIPPIFAPDSCTIALMVDNTYLGFLQYYAFAPNSSDIADECYISWLYVDSKYRGRKFGTKLVQELQSFIRTLPSYKSITSVVLKDNKASQRVHRQLGFKSTNKITFEIDPKLKKRVDLLRWEV